MTDLEKYFVANNGRLVDKWKHYFEIYEQHFARFRNKPVNILEIGLFQGGSIEMWKHYFGTEVKIYGADINPGCERFNERQVQIFIGDQADREFLKSLVQRIPRIDILIDDGGHTMKQQITTFEELFSHISENGIYLCEDLHTSYWAEYGGGYRRKGSFIEYSKHLIDQLNAWHSVHNDGLAVNQFTQTTHSLHYYDSVLVIEKRPMLAPTHRTTGTASIPEYRPQRNITTRIKDRVTAEWNYLVTGQTKGKNFKYLDSATDKSNHQK